jgi:hypothetical protein
MEVYPVAMEAHPKPWRLNLEVCVKAKPGVVEVYPRVMEDHPGAIEAHLEALEAHP